MSSRGLGGGGGSQTKRRERWLLGSLAGRGDADLRANKAHELFDLHVSTGPEDVAAGWDMLSAGLTAGTPIYVETEGTSTSIYTCFRGPKTCRDGGNADLRVNRGHEHLDLHVFQGAQPCFGMEMSRSGTPNKGSSKTLILRNHTSFLVHSATCPI